MEDVVKTIDHASQQGPLWFVLAFTVIISVSAFFIVRKLYAVNERNGERRDAEVAILIKENQASREAHHATIQAQASTYAASLIKMLEEQHTLAKQVAVVVAQNTAALTDNTAEIRRSRETQERIERRHKHE